MRHMRMKGERWRLEPRTKVFGRERGNLILLYQIFCFKGTWSGEWEGEVQLGGAQWCCISWATRALLGICPCGSIRQQWGYRAAVLGTGSQDWKPYSTPHDYSCIPKNLLLYSHGLLEFPEYPTKIQRKSHFIITGNCIISRLSRASRAESRAMCQLCTQAYDRRRSVSSQEKLLLPNRRDNFWFRNSWQPKQIVPSDSYCLGPSTVKICIRLLNIQTV